jgi:uncharacterized membrane protein
MECATTLLALAVLVALPLAVAAYRQAKASAAAQSQLEAELNRMRKTLDALTHAQGIGAPVVPSGQPLGPDAARAAATSRAPAGAVATSPHTAKGAARPAAEGGAARLAVAGAAGSAALAADARPARSASLPGGAPVADGATTVPEAGSGWAPEPGPGAEPALASPSARPLAPAPGSATAATFAAQPIPPPPPAGPPPWPAAPPNAATAPHRETPAGAPAGLPPPPRGTFEELIGARVMPWLGALALALAGAYLVKLSFEHGWISPPVRVALGVAFGVALLAASQVLRRSSGLIGEALAAAGIADLFASFLAAVHLYHLVPPAAGFALMALTTAVAVVLALRQGAMVALLGLVGGFLTPALVRTEQPSARGLFLYLLLLVAGLMAVARRRGWPWLAFSALVAGLIWAAVWLNGPFHAADGLWLSLFLIALAAAGATTPGALPGSGGAATPPGGLGAPAAAAPGPPPATLAAIGGAVILLGATVSTSGYSPAECGFLALLMAGVLLLAWLDARYLALAWLAAGTGATLLTAWGSRLDAADVRRFLLTAAALGGEIALAGWAAALAGETSWHRRLAPDAPPFGAEPAGLAGDDLEEYGPPPAFESGAGSAATHAAVWAALSAATGVAFFVIAWTAARRVAALSSAQWSAVALALAALYLAAALPLGRRWRRTHEPAGALAALAVAVTTLVSVAVPLAVEGRSLAAAWALEVAALVWLAGRFELPVLRGLARVLTVAALLGTLASGAATAARGGPAVFDELLYAYGLPLAALAAAARLALRRGAAVAEPPVDAFTPWRLGGVRGLGDELTWAAVIFGFLLLTLEIDQLFQPAGTALPFALFAGPEDLGLTECAAIAAAWLLFGWALLRGNWPARRQKLHEPPATRALERCGRLLLALGLGATFLGSGLAWNPLWTHQAVGSLPVANLLLAAYALPAALAVAGAAEVRRRGGRRLPALAKAAALILGFALVTTEVRQAFHGNYLDRPPAAMEPGGFGAAVVPIAAERYSYSAAWVAYGIALLVAGISRRSAALRYGSLAVMLVAVLKTFLYDTAQLSDLYRVLSFLGLGASLLLLAALYQKFILHGDRP